MSGSRPTDRRRPRLLAISDRLAEPLALKDWAIRLRRHGVGAIQLREKDLDDLALLASVRQLATALSAAVGPDSRPWLLVNGRADIARAAGAQGVHLPSLGAPLVPLRAAFPGLIFGRSTHTLEEVRQAREDGADYVTFGPIFPTPSKRAYGPPAGLEGLAEAARIGVPVIALGGITDPEDFVALAEHGAVGAAGIRLFRGDSDLRVVVQNAQEAFV